jgi:Uma2 family endonuclease
MTALKHPSPASVADYLAGEEIADVKHEYLGGVIHAMAGGNSRHSAISTSAVGSLVAQLRGKPCQPFNSDMKVRIELPDHTRFYYPDAMVVCSRGPDAAHFQDHPVVIVEVLSESTRRVDLTEKRDAYLAIGTLKQLILVEPDEPRVVVYRRKATGGFEAEEHLGLNSVVPLPEIEAELPLSELYERVTF